MKRIDEATNSLNKMQRELDQLAPLFEASKTDVQLRQEAVEACQKEYAAAKDRCKKQEQDIELMQGPIEILKREAQAEFEKVSIHGWIKAPRGKQRPCRGSCMRREGHCATHFYVYLSRDNFTVVADFLFSVL